MFTFFQLIFWGRCAFAQQIDLKEINDLIKNGKASEAYVILSREEVNNAGDVDFDYLLGLSALDSGQADKAIMIFDRILIANPKFLGVRVDQARAYFILGSYDLAEKEFNEVVSASPPENVMQVARKYLNAIEQARKPKANIASAYIEMAVGHDGNVNASTSAKEIMIPALNNLSFSLASTSMETSSSYISLATGFELAHLIEPNLYLFGGVDVRKKNTPDATAFSNGDIAAHFGVKGGNDKTAYSLSLQLDRFYLGGNPNRDTRGVTGQIIRSTDQNGKLLAILAFNELRYVQSASKQEDMNMVLMAIGYQQLLNDMKVALTPMIVAGKEYEVNDRANGDKDIIGVRLNGLYQLNGNLALMAGVSEQAGFYKKENSAFLVERMDHQYDVSLGLSWQVNNEWSLRPQATYTKNYSNIAIYQYDRADLSVTARWDYR